MVQGLPGLPFNGTSVEVVLQFRNADKLERDVLRHSISQAPAKVAYGRNDGDGGCYGGEIFFQHPQRCSVYRATHNLS